MVKKGYAVYKNGWWWRGGDSWSTCPTDPHVGSFGQASVVAKEHNAKVVLVEILVGVICD